LLENGSPDTKTLVAARDADERRADTGPRRVRPRRSPQHRPVAETLCRTQPAPQVGRLRIRDVDADLLHQPRR